MRSTELSTLADLQLERLGDTEVIIPVTPTDTKPFFLSKIDQSLVYPVETIHFFAPNPRRPVTNLVSILRDALGKVLVPYHFLAGRLRRTDSGGLEVDCNRDGAPFTHYRSGLQIADLGDLEQQNPVFQQLVPHNFGTTSIIAAPLLAVQATVFACGGFALGFMTNHAIMDGMATANFLRNFGFFARGEGILFTPDSDRSPLMTRDPPMFKYDHPELVDTSAFHGQSPFTTVRDVASKNAAEWGANWTPTYVTKIFSFTSERIKTLKVQAMEGCLVHRASTFDVLAVLLWLARTKAVELPEENHFNMLFAVDIRRVMKPALSQHYSGNAVSIACVRATSKEVEKFSFPEAVRAIQQATARVTDDYLRSSLDYQSIKKVVPGVCGGFALTAWYKLPFSDVDYGWGKPIYWGPCASSMTNIVLLSVLLLSNFKQEGAVNMKISLKPEEMVRFQTSLDITST